VRFCAHCVAPIFFMSSVSLAHAHPPFVLVLDLGTSSLRAFIYDAHARAVDGFVARRAYEPQTDDYGQATFDPRVMFDTFCSALDELVAQVDFDIAAVAASSLASNVLSLDANDEPLTPAYLYSDTQNARAVEQLRAAYDWTPIYARTGCPLHTSYLPARLLWLRETQPDIFARATRWVALHEYFLLRLFGRAVVSHSFAAWSGLLNHATLAWDIQVLNIVGVVREQLSPLSSAYAGLRGLRDEYATRWKRLAQIPWLPAWGDGALANLGSGCADETRVAVTAGTSGAMRVVMKAERAVQTLPRGLWLYRVDETDGLIGGSLNNGGNVLAYLARILQLPARDELERALQAMPPDAHGLTLLPFFAGERSPGYRGDARAALTGWHLSTTALEIWRAALEAIAYRFAAIYALLRQTLAPPRAIIASGAALLHSPAWIQMLADVLGVPVTASGEAEASARGAALMALRALHCIQDFAALPAALGETYTPRAEHFEIYQRAQERQKVLYHRLVEHSA
jgi:gluconokinase